MVCEVVCCDCVAVFCGFPQLYAVICTVVCCDLYSCKAVDCSVVCCRFSRICTLWLDQLYAVVSLLILHVLVRCMLQYVHFMLLIDQLYTIIIL